MKNNCLILAVLMLSNYSIIAAPGSSLPVTSDVYLLSIGISNYTANNLFSFANCDDDALKFSGLIRNQHKLYTESPSRLFVYELLDEEATYQNIIDHLNLIISSARPEDFFFFNFSGFTWQIPDSAGNEEIFFFPYVTYDISQPDEDAFTDRSDKISLRQMRDLLEFIPAQNQLLVTEAGLTPRFRTDFAKAMIETSPAISQLARRNRVIIVPEEFGQDSYFCNGDWVQGGPIMNFLLEAGSKQSLFGLFSSDPKLLNRTRYAIQRQEYECEEFTSPYTSFFFERDFVKEMQYFMGDYESRSRGTGTLWSENEEELEKIGEPYALVIGTNNYQKGAPTWKDLQNPIEDAIGISTALKTDYGFNVQLLLDPPVDTLIAALKRYSRILDEEDQFILFIAGHGDYDPVFFDDGFLVMSNSLSPSKDPYRRTYLPFTQLRNIVDNLPARQILLLIDVCFGGAFDEKISGGEKRSGPDPYADAGMELLLQDKLPLNTRIVLSSGSLNEVPDGYRGKHSPFAARLITCLHTKGRENGYLTTIQLFDFVQRLPSRPVLGELQGNEGGAEFFLIAK
jgi:hypothetical protein